MSNAARHERMTPPLAGVGTVADYWRLMKPNVMGLVVFTGLVGIVAAPRTVHPVLALASLLCIAVGAGAAGALNMWYERDIDAAMQRTRSRPIPCGRVRAEEAATFGGVLAFGSVMSMAFLVSYVAAALLALTIAFYLFVYTMWLKPRTPQNIVIGGASGALPPVIGWASVTGRLDIEALALFLIIFLWTPPHFWALALYRTADYDRVGMPMLPVVAGAARTRLEILIYSVLLVASTFLPYVMGYAGELYLLIATVSGIGFLVHAFRLWVRGRAADRAGADRKLKVAADQAARGLFRYSTYYLFALFAVLLIEHTFEWVSRPLFAGL